MALITHLLGAFAFMPDARRVAPIRACVLRQELVRYEKKLLREKRRNNNRERRNNNGKKKKQ